MILLVRPAATRPTSPWSYRTPSESDHRQLQVVLIFQHVGELGARDNNAAAAADSDADAATKSLTYYETRLGLLRLYAGWFAKLRGPIIYLCIFRSKMSVLNIFGN